MVRPGLTNQIRPSQSMEKESKLNLSSLLTPKEVVAQIAQVRTDAINNGLKIAGIGLATGIVASLTVFRRSTAPIYLGLGFGAGMGFSQGRRNLQDFYASQSITTSASSECPMIKKP